MLYIGVMRWAGACGAYEGGERCAQGSDGGNMRERDQWGDSDVDGKIILRWIFQEVGGSCGDWMELAQDRDSWRTLVGTLG